MKTYYFIIAAVCFAACSNSKNSKSAVQNNQHIQKSEFQSILDSAQVTGAILIYDLQKNSYYSNNFDWANKGQLPASTFKIPNSIIALETGVVANDSTLFKWDGQKRSFKVWEQDLILREAFHFSCVPCYQDVARQIGEQRMKAYLHKLDYGNIKVDASNIALFWLQGDSRISPFQQIEFLKRFYTAALPISARTSAIMKRLMLIEETEHYKISGKTGLSDANGKYNGWFVGYLETEGKVYFFATNVEPSPQTDMEQFSTVRKAATYQALKQFDNK